MQKDGPTDDELQRAQNMIETGLITSLETLGGFGGVADRLNQYNHYVHDPGLPARGHRALSHGAQGDGAGAGAEADAQRARGGRGRARARRCWTMCRAASRMPARRRQPVQVRLPRRGQRRRRLAREAAGGIRPRAR